MKKLSLFAISLIMVMFTSCDKEDENNNILGCTNSAALNYNASANQDDGTCIIQGCMDETAMNYNASATIESTSDCEYFGDIYAGTYDATEECVDTDPYSWSQVISSEGNTITLVNAFGYEGDNISIPVSSSTSFSIFDYPIGVVEQEGFQFQLSYSQIEGQVSNNLIEIFYVIEAEELSSGEIIEVANCSAQMTLSDGGGRYSNLPKQRLIKL